MSLIELPDAEAVDDFLSRDAVVLLFVGSGLDQPADAVLASLCALGPLGRVARTPQDAGAAEGRVRRLLTHYPQTDRACLALVHGLAVVDVLRSSDVEAHGARWAQAHFAERFLTRLADT
ncbi:hypothetical protein [Streptomyces sp. NPDC058701]|uniref:hypothetical protein n=1 Tax=Streptomyces sp. NPDC058701 TaxID=3346608 RepID=UPI0036483073